MLGAKRSCSLAFASVKASQVGVQLVFTATWTLDQSSPFPSREQVVTRSPVPDKSQIHIPSQVEGFPGCWTLSFPLVSRRRVIHLSLPPTMVPPHLPWRVHCGCLGLHGYQIRA